MNREYRRKFYKKHHKKLGLGTWDQFNSSFEKEKPYINVDKKLKEKVQASI